MMIRSFCDQNHFNQDWELLHVNLESGAEFIHRHPPYMKWMDASGCTGSAFGHVFTTV